MKKPSRKDAIEELHELAEQAMRSSVEKVVLTHRQLGLPLAIWRDGKVIQLPAERLAVRESNASYRTKKPSR